MAVHACNGSGQEPEAGGITIISKADLDYRMRFCSEGQITATTGGKYQNKETTFLSPFSERPCVADLQMFKEIPYCL